MRRGLECKDLCFSRVDGDKKETVILDQISARFEAGRITLISGRTGAGKSTLLHILGGLIRPTEGRVLANEKPVSQWLSVHRDQWRRNVGIVFQQHHLLEELTVLENIMLPMIPRRVNVSELRQRGHNLLSTLGLSHAAGSSPGKLSGGQRQQAALARAVISDPEFILADEPTSFQDDRSTENILGILRARASKGATVVICSHDSRVRRESVFDDWFMIDNHHLLKASDPFEPEKALQNMSKGDPL